MSSDPRDPVDGTPEGPPWPRDRASVAPGARSRTHRRRAGLAGLAFTEGHFGQCFHFVEQLINLVLQVRLFCRGRRWRRIWIGVVRVTHGHHCVPRPCRPCSGNQKHGSQSRGTPS